MSKKRLIIFTRYPEPGKVKTRLIPALGPQGAADIHKKTTEYTVSWANILSQKYSDLLEVRYDGQTLQHMIDWLGAEHTYTEQGQGDLGQRMARAFQENFQSGKRQVVLVGTDCPRLNVFLCQMAFRELKTHDMVIGPTMDGGYFLIGLRKMVPQLFQSIDWGTDTVYSTTMSRAIQMGLSVKSLEALQDVDVPQDLPIWEKVFNQYLSIIIPTLNEESHLGKTLENLREDDDSEVIVSDGGSKDRTVSLAREWGAKVISSDPGRGIQMNAGAEKASGDILLFLHADTLLPSGFSNLVRHAMSDPKIAGGYFAWKVYPTSPMLRYVQMTVNWRTRIFGFPYGDQAFFVRASLFHQMGGYAPIPLMEDVEFIRRLKKMGKVAFIPAPVITSPRLFQTQGALRTTLKNKVILFGYFFGVSPQRLAQMYYKKR